MKNQIVHQSSWAISAGKRPIELFSSLHSLSPPLLFIGGVHGDEPEGIRLAQDLLKWLLKNNSEKINPWILIPILNVDGAIRSERTNENGVDLNRNFPVKDWSPNFSAPRYFPGSHPASEPEIQKLIELIDQHKPEAIFHFHSWEPCVVYTGQPGEKWAKIVGNYTPYQIKEDIGYPTPGSLGQYGWLEKNIPVICIEEQEKIHLDLVWPHFGQGLIDCLSAPQF